jgi:hypothetical protein
VCGQNVEFVNVKLVVHVVTTVRYSDHWGVRTVLQKVIGLQKVVVIQKVIVLENVIVLQKAIALQKVIVLQKVIGL